VLKLLGEKNTSFSLIALPCTLPTAYTISMLMLLHINCLSLTEAFRDPRNNTWCLWILQRPRSYLQRFFRMQGP